MSNIFRRSTNEARLEMTPLLDVIFLLLTFFIYSQLLLSKTNILPVSLPTVTTGAKSEKADVIGITLDRRGALYLNEKPISMKELNDKLGGMTDHGKKKVLVAVEDAPSNVDRVMQLISLTDLLRRSGFAEFNLAVKPPLPPAVPAEK
ncbi:MAG: biopolymer transporter ExbD [Phycisphaeraceae bacterium]